MPRSVYRWTRDLHLYAGLFLSPIVLLYAVSVVLLVHAARPWGGRDAAGADTVRVAVADSENSLDVARAVQRQLDIRGEIGFINRKPGTPRLSFPIETPG